MKLDEITERVRERPEGAQDCALRPSDIQIRVFQAEAFSSLVDHEIRLENNEESFL